jgi:hypothetical protein
MDSETIECPCDVDTQSIVNGSRNSPNFLNEHK